jgi:hypothetical protein
MVVALATVSALTAVFAAGVLTLAAGLAVRARLTAATVFTAEAAALTALPTVALSTASAAVMTATAAAAATIAVETEFAAGAGLIGGLLGSGGFAAEEAFDPGDQTAAGFLFFDRSGRRGDGRRGAGLFLEAAGLAGFPRLALCTWITGVARIARLAWFPLIAWVTRLARFAEIAALLRWVFGARSFAGGCGAVLSGFGIALAMAFGAEDRAIAAAVPRARVVVGGLSASGKRRAIPALGGARFVFGR